MLDVIKHCRFDEPMSRHTFTEAEYAFLASPRGLARIATVDPTGMPHVVPTGWTFDAQNDTLLLTGRDVGSTQRVKHLAGHSKAAVVIDGVDDTDGWRPWALVVRGDASYDRKMGAIQLIPASIISCRL